VLVAEIRHPLRDVTLDVTLEVAPEQPIALVGRSGAGKTTVLRVIAGLHRAQHAVVRCGDDVWCDTGARLDHPPDARRCALLHQDDALFPHLPAWRNVAFGLRGVARRERRGAAVELLDRFGIAALADAMPRTLSGGERRRVALARALAAGPPVLLLDEPFTGLDEATRADARAAVRQALALAAVPTIVVTHDPQDAVELGAAVVLLETGHARTEP